MDIQMQHREGAAVFLLEFPRAPLVSRLPRRGRRLMSIGPVGEGVRRRSAGGGAHGPVECATPDGFNRDAFCVAALFARGFECLSSRKTGARSRGYAPSSSSRGVQRCDRPHRWTFAGCAV